MKNSLDFTITIPDHFRFENFPVHSQTRNDEPPSLAIDPKFSTYTYQMIAKPVIDHLDTYGQTWTGFFKREVITRIYASFISAFQAVDFAHAVTTLAGRGLEVLAHSIGVKNLSTEDLQKTHEQMRGNAADLARFALGCLFGSVLSVIKPSCFVPFLYAPSEDITEDPVDGSKKYDFDNAFGKTIAINLNRAKEKREILAKHLNEIGVHQWERFEAVNGYELSDDYPLQIKNQTATFKGLYSRMPGKTDKHKKARLGCYLSHLFVLKKARDECLPSVLIIEDDAIFPQTRRGVESFNRTMEELPHDWELLFIGIEHDREPTRYSPHIDRVLSGTCLHSYAVHSRCYDRLIEDMENALLSDAEPLLPVDEVISEQLEKYRYQAFSPHTLVGYQRNGLVSNITGYTNTAYPLVRQFAQRVYSHLLAPWLTDLGLPKYKMYKSGLRVAKALNIPIESMR
jgi:GR25 family glycosyltransferase involved in LPS biosynthesis